MMTEIDNGTRWASLDTYKPAPLWMLKYVGALVAIVQHKRPLRVVVAPQEFFDTVPKSSGKAVGACMMLPDGEDVIVMSEQAQDTEPWRDVLAHEFAHVLHTPLDRLAIDSLSAEAVDAYERELETLVKVVGGLLAFAEPYVRSKLAEKGLVYTNPGAML